jgi:hypothetical protein
MKNGTRNEGEEAIGRRDEDDAQTETDTIAVGFREGDEEDEAMIDGDLLEGLSSTVLGRWLLRGAERLCLTFLYSNNFLRLR